MKNLLTLIFVSMFLFFSCEEEQLDNRFELNKIQTFVPGVTYQMENSETTFRIDDLNDSRCPTGGTCIWAGMVQIDIVFDSQTTDTLRLNTDNMQLDTIGNYIFQIMEVTPYPELDKQIELKDYRVTLKISN